MVAPPAGLRWEKTSTDASEPDPRSVAEMRAADFGGNQVTSGGLATTIPAITYMFLSQPRIHRLGGYDNLFPSASLKYSLLRNLDFHFGYSSTIRRPSYVNVAGVWLFNENVTPPTVTAPNPHLKPETADNYGGRSQMQ